MSGDRADAPDGDGALHSDDSDASPWATDRIPPAAPSVMWDTPVSTGGVAPAGPVMPGPADPDPETDSDGADAPTRRWQWLAVAAGIVAAVAFAAWSLGGDEPTGDSAAADDDSPVTSAALDVLPDPDAPSERDGSDEDDADDAATDIDDGDASGSDDATSTAMELPAAVAAIDQPTEVVALTASGDLHTLSLPSGTLRTVTLGAADGGASLSVSPDASLIVPYQGRATVLVPRSGPPITIDRDQFDFDDGSPVSNIEGYGWIPDGDDSTAILAVAYAATSSDRGQYLIRNDGTIEEDPSGIGASNFAFILTSPGARIANDAGGVYRIGGDGSSTRISDGYAVAGSETTALIRECDAERRCSYVLRSLDGADSTPLAPEAASAVDGAQFDATLSPDGSALSYHDFSGESQRVLVDLTTGDTVRADDSQNGFFGTPAWALDGSGLFVTGGPQGGLGFLDRGTGEVVSFGEDLGQIVAIGVRYPDAELVDRTLTADDITFSTAPAASVGLDVVTVGRLGSMTHIDLDAATSTSWETPGVPGNPPPRLFADAGRVLAVSGNGSQAYVAEFGMATELDPDTALEPPFLQGPADGTVWTRSPTGALDIDAVLVGLDGETRSDGVGVAVDDATLLGGDGFGGLIIAAGGDVYVTSGGDPAGFTTGLRRLTSGEILAIGPDHVLVRECDAVRACTTVHLDRATGEASGLDTTPVAAADAIDAAREVSTVGSLSPDGSVVLARFTKSGTAENPPNVVETWAFVDLTTGGSTVVPEPSRDQPVVWNDDGTYAIVAADDGLVLFERSTATTIDIIGGADVRGFTRVDAGFAEATPESDQG